MKFPVLLAVILCSCLVANAQDTPKNRRTDTSGTTDQFNDYYTVQSAKVVLMRAGNPMPLITSFKLSNGAILQTDGMILSKDGQQHTLRPGEKLYLDGRIINSSGLPVPIKRDSTP